MYIYILFLILSEKAVPELTTSFSISSFVPGSVSSTPPNMQSGHTIWKNHIAKGGNTKMHCVFPTFHHLMGATLQRELQ